MKVTITISPQDVADLKLEAAHLIDYLANLGPSETEEHREQRARNERRLALMLRLLGERA